MGGQNVIKVNMVTEYENLGRAGYPFSIQIRPDATVKELKAACATKARKRSPAYLVIRADGKYLKEEGAKLNKCPEIYDGAHLTLVD